MDISLFVGFKGSPHTSTGSTTITDFISSIKYGTWREQVEPIRLEENKDKREILKKKLPTVTIGGLFKIRSAETLIKHSGFICIDIDGYTDKSELAADPYTYSLFKSVSGKGLAVIAKINPEKHAESYNWLASYYYAKYGITSDPLPKNVASLRFVSFDPDIFVNEKFLKRMNGTEPLDSQGTKRTTGEAWDKGVGYEYEGTLNVRMDGNNWTTLCPAPMFENPVFPTSNSNRKGW